MASSQPVPALKQQPMMGAQHRPQRALTEDQDAPSSSAPASSTPATDEPYVLTFGKHIGKTIDQVPLYYAAWLKTDCIAYSVNSRMREAIDSYLADDAPSSQPTFSQYSRSSQPMPNPTELAAGSQPIRQRRNQLFRRTWTSVLPAAGFRTGRHQISVETDSDTVQTNSTITTYGHHESHDTDLFSNKRTSARRPLRAHLRQTRWKVTQ